MTNTTEAAKKKNVTGETDLFWHYNEENASIR